MSYRAFKRLLGETSLERKCRYLLGSVSVVLITGSFWFYARQTEKIAYKQTADSGRLLVPPIIVSRHRCEVRTPGRHEAVSKDAMKQFQAETEKKWPTAFSTTIYTASQAERAHARRSRTTPACSTGFSVTPNISRKAAKRPAGKVTFTTAPFGRPQCLGCHNKPGVDAPAAGTLEDGDLMAVVWIRLSGQGDPGRVPPQSGDPDRLRPRHGAAHHGRQLHHRPLRHRQAGQAP